MPRPLQEILDPIIEHDSSLYTDTTWGVAILDNNGQLEYGHQPDEVIAAASFTKLSAAYALDRVGTPLDTSVEVQASDYRRGNGILQYAPEGHQLTLGDAAELALKISDNTALRIIMRSLGGPAEVNDVLFDDSQTSRGKGLGLYVTHFGPVEGEQDSDPAAAFTQGATTARESARLLQQVLIVPRFAAALQHSNYGGGLRNEIHPMEPTTLGQRMRIRWAQWTGDFTYLQEHSGYPLTQYPGKEGTVIDDEEHLRHHAAQIGDRIVSVMTESQTYEYLPSNPEEHHVRQLQGRIGTIVKEGCGEDDAWPKTY